MNMRQLNIFSTKPKLDLGKMCPILILVSLMMTLFSEVDALVVLISNLIKKSWTNSNVQKMNLLLIYVFLYIRVRPRFFDQVGRQNHY